MSILLSEAHKEYKKTRGELLDALTKEEPLKSDWTTIAEGLADWARAYTQAETEKLIKDLKDSEIEMKAYWKFEHDKRVALENSMVALAHKLTERDATIEKLKNIIKDVAFNGRS